MEKAANVVFALLTPIEHHLQNISSLQKKAESIWKLKKLFPQTFFDESKKSTKPNKKE